MFSIKCIKTNLTEDINYGRITIDDFEELFELPTDYWNFGDYISHWVKELTDVVEGKTKTALLTTMFYPDQANFFITWPIYRDGDTVYVQNRIIFLEEIEGDFEIEKLSEYVGDRMTIDEDGKKISEWKTDIASIKEFLGSCDLYFDEPSD